MIEADYPEGKTFLYHSHSHFPNIFQQPKKVGRETLMVLSHLAGVNQNKLHGAIERPNALINIVKMCSTLPKESH